MSYTKPGSISTESFLQFCVALFLALVLPQPLDAAGAATINGTGLSGSVNQSASAGNGGRAYDVRDYGATGDARTDDTTGLQSLLNRFSDRNTGRCKSGVIYFPQGSYVISKSLFYSGAPGCSLRIEGGPPQSRGGTGSTILWKGPAGVPMLLMRGANQTEIDHLEFNANKIAACGIYATADNTYRGAFTQAVSPGVHTVAVSSTANLTAGTWLGVDSGSHFEIVQVTSAGSGTLTADFAQAHASWTAFGGGAGSSGLWLEHVSVINLSGAETVGLALGNPTTYGTPQVSEVHVQNTDFKGDGTALAGIKQFSAGDTKNMWISDSGANGFQYGFMLNYSAVYTIIGGDFGGISKADVFSPGGWLTIIGTESEDKPGAAFVTNGGGANSGNSTLTLIGNSWQTQPPSAGYVVTWNGNITLIDNALGISGSENVAKVKDAGGTFSIFSEGNTYINAPAGYAPFYDGSGQPILAERNAKTMPPNVTSLEDNGGAPRAFVNLKNTLAAGSVISGSARSAAASTGLVKAANGDFAVMFRNSSNTGDMNGLSKDARDVVQVGGKGGIRLGSSGPTWTYGPGIPKGACKTGSLYTRTDGTPGATLYACEAGAWAAK